MFLEKRRKNKLGLESGLGKMEDIPFDTPEECRKERKKFLQENLEYIVNQFRRLKKKRRNINKEYVPNVKNPFISYTGLWEMSTLIAFFLENLKRWLGMKE